MAPTTRITLRAAIMTVVILQATWVSGATDVIYIALPHPGTAVLVIQQTADGTKKAVLFDTGCALSGCVLALQRELAKQGVTCLDAVVISHWDADHAGGLLPLLRSTLPGLRDPNKSSDPIRGPPAIGVVIEPGAVIPASKSVAHNTTQALNDAGIPVLDVTHPEAASRLQGLSVEPLFLERNRVRTSNDSSIALIVHDVDGGKPHLLTGDLTHTVFEAIRARLPRHVRSLMAPHHGADDVLISLALVTHPELVVASANLWNQYAHPNVQVILALLRFGGSSQRLERDLYRLAADTRSRWLEEQTGFKGLERYDGLMKIRRASASSSVIITDDPFNGLAVQQLRQSVGPPTTGAEDLTRPDARPSTQMLSTNFLFFVTGTDGTIRVHPRWAHAGSLSPEQVWMRRIALNTISRLDDREVEGIRSWPELSAFAQAKTTQLIRTVGSEIDFRDTWLDEEIRTSFQRTMGQQAGDIPDLVGVYRLSRSEAVRQLGRLPASRAEAIQAHAKQTITDQHREELVAYKDLWDARVRVAQWLRGYGPDVRDVVTTALQPEGRSAALKESITAVKMDRASRAQTARMQHELRTQVERFRVARRSRRGR